MLYTNTVFYTKTYKNHLLAGPVQALFAACRIALSCSFQGQFRDRQGNKDAKGIWARLSGFWTAKVRISVANMRIQSVNTEIYHNWLVVWTPLKNISQLGWLFPIYGKIKNVPNHQPDNFSGHEIPPSISHELLNGGNPWLQLTEYAWCTHASAQRLARASWMGRSAAYLISPASHRDCRWFYLVGGFFTPLKNII